MLILADASPPTGSFIRAVIGVVGLLALAYFFSEDRKKVNWRVVGGGLALQCAIALGVLRLSWIEAFFGWIAGLFATALDISVQAAGFVFGPLSDIVTMNAAFEGRGFVFAFMALPSILFFSALSSLLYYFGILQLVVRLQYW